MYYPSGYEHSSLGIVAPTCICDACCHNNCDECIPNKEVGYDYFAIEEKEDEYWEQKLSQ